jgi:peptidyl-prolyl cis-trans isomerase D
MITWMQRHKKYLIITIWISTIAFIGAGFVGWGQYSYGDKAGAVAKVGSVEISKGELQKSYSNLYAQYSQMFQGAFDEEKAKAFGLQKQALSSLVNQALVLNLAKSYSLQVSDDELLDEIKKQKYFFKNGVFDKEIYKKVLSRNNMTIQEYEKDLKKQLLVQKTLRLLKVEVNDNEQNIIPTIMSIADKINYKVLDDSSIVIDTSDKLLKPYWEQNKQNFMSEVTYDVKVIKQEKITKDYDEAKIKEHYNDNKTHFRDDNGKILAFDKAKQSVIKELNTKATKDAALRTYIAYKKGKLPSDTKVLLQTLSNSKNPYNDEILQKVSKLSLKSPFLKPVLFNGEYFTFELVKRNPSVPKSYEDAKKDVLPLYISKQKKEKLVELAEKSISTFSGKTTGFITNTDAYKLNDMDIKSANQFLVKLFMQQKKNGYIQLENGNIVLYNILEQKLLKKLDNNKKENGSIVKIKTTMFNEGLIKNLQNKYKTEIFMKGL